MLGGVTRMTSRRFELKATNPSSHDCPSFPRGDHVRVDRRVISCFAHHGFCYDSEMGWGSVWK